MNPNYLDFEQPIADLEAKIQELRHASHGPAVNIDAEVHALQDKLRQRTAHIFRDLTPWQVSQLARHPARPYTLDYIRVICDEFQELAGDRAFADDDAIVGGLARIDGRSVMIIGHQKGRDTKSQDQAQLRHAAPRGLPQGAAPDEAGRTLRPADPHLHRHRPAPIRASAPRSAASPKPSRATCWKWPSCKVPIICTVIGEGGSGGALAIGVGDRTLMLEYSTYSVITPEGCASILWKSADKAKDAAEQMGITAKRLLELGLIDKLVREPIGGAHRNPTQMARRLKAVLLNELDALEQLPADELLQRRYERLRGYGAYEAA